MGSKWKKSSYSESNGCVEVRQIKTCAYCNTEVENYPDHIRDVHRDEFALAWQAGGGGT